MDSVLDQCFAAVSSCLAEKHLSAKYGLEECKNLAKPWSWQDIPHESLQCTKGIGLSCKSADPSTRTHFLYPSRPYSSFLCVCIFQINSISNKINSMTNCHLWAIFSVHHKTTLISNHSLMIWARTTPSSLSTSVECSSNQMINRFCLAQMVECFKKSKLFVSKLCPKKSDSKKREWEETNSWSFQLGYIYFAFRNHLWFVTPVVWWNIFFLQKTFFKHIRLLDHECIYVHKGAWYTLGSWTVLYIDPKCMTNVPIFRSAPLALNLD